MCVCMCVADSSVRCSSDKIIWQKLVGIHKTELPRATFFFGARTQNSLYNEPIYVFSVEKNYLWGAKFFLAENQLQAALTHCKHPQKKVF